jgi:hypothetical protein
MEPQRIEILLNKYLDAETSLKEESILRDYFNNNNVESHLEPYKAMFTYFNEAKLETSSEPFIIPTKKRNLVWMNIAASIVVILGMHFGFEAKEKYEIQTAYNQTESAFNLLTNNLNKGAASMAYMGEFNKATNKIFK